MNPHISIVKPKKKPFLDFLPYKKKETEKLTVVSKRPLKSILVLTTYPPRECGIATYSKDLLDHLNRLFSESYDIKICALNNENENPTYSKDISFVLNTDSEESFETISRDINSDSSIHMVVVQHEFGLFNQNPPSFLKLLKHIHKPVVLTFHTVLPQPDASFKNYVESLIFEVNHLIVMTNSSKDILVKDYNAPKEMISVVPHGTHLIPHNDKTKLKQRYGLDNKMILSTFGLLGPGKSIETTLDALALIANDYPNLLFLIIGKTHPGVTTHNGETYREFLEQKIMDLNLGAHVKFINEFVPTSNLLEYLQLSDIYLFTSKDPNQAVSGTFSYAMSCGCPIISTPIPHAREFLKEDKGLLFEFGNAPMLAEQIRTLLENELMRKNLGLNNLHSSSASAWENSAMSHAKIFNALEPKLKLRFNKPEVSLDHLRHMTTATGILQFSKLNQPDLESGYTLDDNARALLVMCKMDMNFKDETLTPLFVTYLSFILNCQRANGTFLNYVDQHSVFTDQNNSVNLDDSNGRAFWALGEVIALSDAFPSKYLFLLDRTIESFEEFLPFVLSIYSPRALGFIIKGLYSANKVLHRTDIDEIIDELAKRLANQYKHETDESWKWFEHTLTYGNSVLPEVMLIAYHVTQKELYKEIAEDSFDFLLSILFRESKIQVISNQTWLKRGDVLKMHPQGGQQAIDVAYTILALQRFHQHNPKRGYHKYMETAFSWFFGNNHLGQTVYNPCTKGCYDGIEANNVNLNQGAESLVSYLLSRLAMDSIES